MTRIDIDTSAAYASISGLDGVAYDYAKHLVDGLIGNEESFGPGTYPTWETTPADFSLMCEVFTAFEGDLDEISDEEWADIRITVLNSVYELQTEYATATATSDADEDEDEAA